MNWDWADFISFTIVMAITATIILIPIWLLKIIIKPRKEK